MDTKALAKSKRAHSLYHTKKNNHYSASKVPTLSSGTAAAGKKPAAEQAGENLRKSHGSRTLPSNWDRYNEEFDMHSEDLPAVSTNEPTEVVLPKSKGADYASLISEAKAQPQLNFSSEFFHSFSDVIDDFTQGFGPMLSVKGESMLSWTAEDDFDFEGKEKISYEAPFLSLNLHSLAEQLGKAKLSERLFLEPDVLLPSELLNGESQACGHVQTPASALEIDSEASSSLIQDIDENEEGQHELVLPSSTITRNNPIAVLREGLLSVDQANNKIEQSQEMAQKSVSKENEVSPAIKASTFEAANAEAELDLLLNSFTETMFREPSKASKKSSHGFESFREKTPTVSSVDISCAQNTSDDIKEKGADTMKSTMTYANIDDDVDSLLEETSNLINVDVESLSLEDSVPTSSRLNRNSKSELQDDFDSWLDTI